MLDMPRQILILALLAAILTACRQANFDSYITKIKELKRPLIPNDLSVPLNNNLADDSLFFGKGFQSLGIISKEKDFYSILLKHKTGLFISTIDFKGNVLDKVELIINNGDLNDSISILSTYELLTNNSLFRTDTIHCNEYDFEGNQYRVAKASSDTIKYSGGKIIFNNSIK
jgi:hypothetical protein